MRRAHQQGPFEHLLATLFCYPFRCQLCRHRFLVLQVGRRPRPQLTDLREYERIRVSSAASFFGENILGEGTTVDISVKGCWIKGEKQVRKGWVLRLRIQRSLREPPIEIETAMVRWVLGNGFGVEFIQVQPKDDLKLRQLVEGLLDSHGAEP